MLTVSSFSYNILGMAVSLAAYPLVLIAGIWLFSIIVRGLSNLSLRSLLKEAAAGINGKQHVKSIFTLIVNLAFSAVIGTLLIWGVYSLPMDRIDGNMKSSAELLYNEGTYPSLYSWCFSRSDNYSDAIILLEASDKTDSSALENAMLSNWGSIDGCDSVLSLKLHMIDGIDFSREVSYSRYWQGYLATIKPLLGLTDYEGIRVVNGSIQIFLMLLICVLLVARGRKDLIIPLLLSYMMLVPPVMGRCLFFSSCFLITLISVIVLLVIKGDRKLPLLFLYTGIATAYVDLMSFPIMTFGIPAVICLSLYADCTTEKKLIMTVKNGLSWCLGYAGMWILKWIIADILTDADVIKAALDMVAVRMSSSEAGTEFFSVFSVFGRNMIAFLFTPVTLMIIAFLIYLYLRNRKTDPDPSKFSRVLLPSALICLIPFLWYAFAANHSIIHYWFTCKSLVIPVFAMMCGMSDNLFILNRKQATETVKV